MADLFSAALRHGERVSDAMLRLFPCTRAQHDALAIECLPYVGIQRDVLAERDPLNEPPPAPLLLADCPRCGSTLTRDITAMLHDPEEIHR